MSFLSPLALLLALLALPILLLYMLRLRRRPVPVSSTLLWRKLVRDRQANAPWQRLRPNLLLLLQLAILAALVLALARPYLPVPAVVSGSVVVLLDGSASMQATDVEPDRFEVARERVAGWIDDLGGDDRMTLIQVGSTPTVLASASGDRRELRQALDEAQAEMAAADWAAALALANGAAQGFREARIVIVSDGGLPPDAPPLAADVVYVPVGQSGANLALSALATRDAGQEVELLAAVTNTGQVAQQTLVSVSLDGVLYDSRRVTVPAGERRNLTWRFSQEVTTVTAELSEQTADYLAADNRAWAVHAGGGGHRALLVTQNNVFLEQGLSVLPGWTTFKTTPDAPLASDDGEAYDLTVFDGVPLPETLPDGDLLVIDPRPAPENDLFRVTGVFSDTTVIGLEETPLLRFVEWGGVNVRRARAVSAPWAQTVVEAQGGPLLLAGEQDGRRIVILTFDLHESDLPLRIAFPVLMANITAWLNPGQAFDAPAGLQPGQPVTISPGAGTTAVQVEKPDGSLWTSDAAEQGNLLFEETAQPGVYRVTVRDAAGDRPAGSFAVNLFAPRESTLAPAPALQLGRRVVEAPGTEDVGRQEVWAWLAAVAFVILVIEWWIHFRGTRLPQVGRRIWRVVRR